MELANNHASVCQSVRHGSFHQLKFNDIMFLISIDDLLVQFLCKINNTLCRNENFSTNSLAFITNEKEANEYDCFHQLLF